MSEITLHNTTVTFDPDKVKSTYTLYIAHSDKPNGGAGVVCRFSDERNNLNYCPNCQKQLQLISSFSGILCYPNIELQSNRELYCLMCVTSFLNQNAEQLEFCKLQKNPEKIGEI